MSAAQQSVIETYKAMHPKSSALYERARGIIPGGVTHDVPTVALGTFYEAVPRGSQDMESCRVSSVGRALDL